MPYTVNVSGISLKFPTTVLIRGFWWSEEVYKVFQIQYDPANNISNSKTPLSALSIRSISNPKETNVHVTYFNQPILTNLIKALKHINDGITYVSDLSKIEGYSGNYWVMNANYSHPFEVELYGCEDFKIEKSKNHVQLFLIQSKCVHAKANISKTKKSNKSRNN